MKHILTFLSAITFFTSAQAQPMISSGFVTGMAAINGNTYAHTSNIGTGNYQYVCAGNDGNFFASSFTNNKLYYIDAAGNAITDSMNIILYDITSGDNNSTVFAVGNLDSVYRINTSTKSIVEYKVIPGAWCVKVRPNTKELWITGNGKMYVLDFTSAFTMSSFNLPLSSTDPAIKFTDGGTQCFVTCYNTKKLYKIDAASKTVTDSSAVLSNGQFCAEVNHDSSKVFISWPGAFRIYVFSAATLALTDSINTGTREPFMLYRHPARHELWAVNHFKDSVTVYNENTYAQIAAFGISSSPHHLAFGKITSGIEDVLAADKNILLFPNPASSKIHLQFSDNQLREIILYDGSGKKIESMKTSTQVAEMNVAGLTPGLYFIQVMQKDKNMSTLSWIKK